MEIFEQSEFILNGKGRIVYGHYEVETDFQISYSTFKIVLKTPGVELGQLFAIDYGKFEGIISESNLKIECNKICLSQFGEHQLTFVFLEDLIIGSDIDFHYFKAPLFGLNIDIDEFKIGDNLISVNKVHNFDIINSFNEKYGYILETSEIVIRDTNSKIMQKDVTVQICKDICLLLSLILAKNIIYNRCEFVDNKNQYQKIIRNKLINNSTGKRFVYDENLDVLLPSLYSNFIELTASEKKCLFTSTDYLNSTSHKFLEDSILSIAQVWEVLSDTLLTEKIENSESINALRKEIKNVVQEWHKTNEIVDYDLGFIKGRVLDSLDWEKVIKKLEKLADNHGLNLERIGLNFKGLISLRNQIAHSGRFKEIGKELEYLDVYDSASLGIKVLILKNLGYNGDITFFTGGIPITKKIEYYLN